MFVIRFLVRLVLLPLKVALAATGMTLRTGVRIGRVPGRVSGRAARLVGARGWALFFVGLAVGLLVSPGGRELRAKLQKVLAHGGADDADLAEKVAFELAHAPRTWHLDQPTVSLIEGRIRLEGSVPTSDARVELARVAAAIPGVVGVDNQLQVVDSSNGDEPAGSDGDG